MSNYFESLQKVDCSSHVEKKGKFSYLSWPFAVAELKKKHPSATWEVKKHEGAPYTKTPAGCFVEVEVDVDGVKLSQIHPVLDNRNQTILEPNAFQVNTSIQRCLVKAIALHGLGLYIYAGEDLPMTDVSDYTEEQKMQFDELLEGEDGLAVLVFAKSLQPAAIDALYNSFEKGQITKGKKRYDTLYAKGVDKVIAIAQELNAMAEQHDPAAIEITNELSNIEKGLVKHHLDAHTVEFLAKLKQEQ